MSDSGYQYGQSRTPTPFGYWQTDNADAGAYWVETPSPENSAYKTSSTGWGDSGSTTTWDSIDSVSPTQVLDYGNWETAQDIKRNEEARAAIAAQQAQAAAPANAPVSPFATRNPAATLNTSATASPIFNPAQPYYQTTNDVQSQYAWSPRSAAQPLAQNIPSWGKQQPTQAFDVNQFIAEMLGPKAQQQTSTLPTPYPGK